MVDSSSPLVRYLRTKSVLLAGRLEEVAGSAERWLEYVPESFPHYTTHTVRHSEAILAALGNLLFRDQNHRRPVLPLSGAEAYILCVAAYLHDAGMVVPAAELDQIVGSAEFAEWVEPGGPGSVRRERIRALAEAASTDAEILAADRQLRFLVTDYVRRSHHTRSAKLVLELHSLFSGLDFGSMEFRTTIADICGAHGLDRSALEDPGVFPDRRDLANDQVNVRLLAILLRLGDLLDISEDRACPISMLAASPLPPDSIAHWTKYSGIRHHLWAPDRIELRVECQTQDEHRFFADWCKWLVDELAFASTVVPRMARHAGWLPPIARLDGPSQTIEIKPAGTAHYVPREWRFELDQATVFDRLVRDIYQGQFTFIRELIQNAADATRCRAYEDEFDTSNRGPMSPTQLSANVRARYPLRVSARWVELENDISGETESRQEVSVEDVGNGMDEEAISRYLLQVGKSYYNTREFSRRFGFIPVSRFGLGFLSVFAESSHVIVETRRQNPASRPLRLLLTGPRNYILTEEGDRPIGGTKITVRLDAQLRPGQLTALVRSWCRRLEFAVQVNDFGAISEVEAERDEDFVSTVPTLDGVEFAIRSFPVEREGIEGSLFVFTYKDELGESWVLRNWARNTFAESHPAAEIPVLPPDLVAIGGITVHEYPADYASTSSRLDHRHSRDDLVVSREAVRGLRLGRPSMPDENVSSRWAEILDAHLASGQARLGKSPWRYRQSLASDFRIGRYWETAPGLIPIVEDSRHQEVSVADFKKMPAFTTVTNPWRKSEHLLFTPPPADGVVLDVNNVEALDRDLLRTMFDGARPTAVRGDGNWLVVTWQREAPPPMFGVDGPFVGFDFTGMDRLAIADVGLSARKVVGLNTSNALGAWLWSVLGAADTSEPRRRLARVIERVASDWRESERLARFVAEWAENQLVPSPPDEVVVDEMAIAPYRSLKVPEARHREAARSRRAERA